jgi:hypothetical protein
MSEKGALLYFCARLMTTKILTLSAAGLDCFKKFNFQPM